MTSLARRLGLGDAILIGLGSMLGAGVFVAFVPAARAAGGGLLIGLGIAALVAFCNATSSAQLAAQYPASGGSYIYGRERLGPWWGFLAGWSFVIGKTASGAAMALAFAAYVAPPAWERPVAIAAVLALTGVNLLGITRTALVTRVLVVVVLLVLGVVIVAGLGSGAPEAGAGDGMLAGGGYGILQAAGLLFFAFAGYARIATLGEEVRDPVRTIPRAIVVALLTTVAIYAAVAVVALGTLGADGLASSSAPLAEIVQARGWGWAEPVVRAGAAVASLGALLALMTGIGRTTLAMARAGDLPHWLSAVHPRFRVPHRAELLLGGVVCVVVLVADVRGAIAFSSFGVLLYYLVANLSAFTQDASHRRYPRWLQVLGVIGCAALVATLPPLGIAVGTGVLVLGVGWRLLTRRRRRSVERPAEPPAA